MSKTAAVQNLFVLELRNSTGKHCRTAIAGKLLLRVDFGSSFLSLLSKTPQNLFSGGRDVDTVCYGFYRQTQPAAVSFIARLVV